MTIPAARLRELGQNYLTLDGQGDLEEHLDNEELERARVYLLGALDSLWGKSEIDRAEAERVYRELGVDPDEASQLRQRHALRS